VWPYAEIQKSPLTLPTQEHASSGGDDSGKITLTHTTKHHIVHAYMRILHD
jgi:hypothetical protein